MNDLQVSPLASVPSIAKEDTAWWDQNRDAVEAKFIGMLLAETTRKPYNGPERRSRATITLDPADIALAQAQAQRLGIAYEEHARRLFHRAVMAEEQLNLA
jgi:hypothetical protein